MKTRALLIVLTAVACAKPQANAAFEVPLGSRHATASRTNARGPVRPPPAPMQKFADTVGVLASSPRIAENRQLVRAFRELADALVLVAPDEADEIKALRDGAELLEAANPRSPEHAENTRIAFARVVRIFSQGAPRARVRMGAYADAVSAFADEIEKIDPELPFTEQYPLVVRAFELANRTLHVALGLARDDAVATRPKKRR